EPTKLMNGYRRRPLTKIVEELGENESTSCPPRGLLLAPIPDVFAATLVWYNEGIAPGIMLRVRR
ncbi:MAG: hypothetical protein ACC628_17290, partial [Pirellulaceae bacterium]